MKPVNFSELLDSQRLRPLWKKLEGATSTLVGATPGASPGKRNQDSHVELGPPQIPVELPHAVLAEFERALKKQFGSSALLLSHLMQPLKAVMAKRDPMVLVRSNHHLRRAASGGIAELIDRIDDALSGLLAFLG